jgi:hypothetical protein
MAIFNNIKKKDTELTRQWDILAREMMEGNVIPVIGPEFLVDDERGSNPHQILIDDLAEAYELKNHPTSFSELLFDRDFDANDRKNIYAMLGDALSQPLFKPSLLLKRLLGTKQFPFVITTSFIPVVEDTMREIWGEDRLRVMCFTNDPSHNDDIRTRSDITKPTVYYMFGKVCRSEKKYVVTDYDMLSFCRSWLSSADRPQNLAAELQTKYLLFLGNNYSDWLARFICFSLKSKFDTQPLGLVVDTMAEDSFLQFLHHIDTFTHGNAEEVVSRIETLIAEKRAEQELSRWDRPLANADVFISYSRADADIAASLYETFSRRGIRVWYDRKSLSLGSDFMHEIVRGIKGAKLFIPIITRNMELQRNEYHPYRTEWQTAIELASGYGRRFIVPVSEHGFDFYGSSIPQSIKDCNAYLYHPENPDFEPLADEIQLLLNSL